MKSKASAAIVITPSNSEKLLTSLSSYRELLFFFIWREFKLRYKQAHLGILWAVLEPLLFMALVNFIIVQRLGARFGADGVPSAYLIFLGFIIWQFFGPSLVGTASSFLNNQALFNKLYFPKILPAVAAITSRLVDFAIAFLLIFLIGIIFGHPMPIITLLLLLPGLAILMLTAYGAGLLLGTLSIKYRDVKHVTPLLMRMLWFGSPVIWPLLILPEKVQMFFYLNPAAAVIETMRQSWSNPALIKWNWLVLPLITLVVFLTLGVRYYKRHEKEMIDIA